MFRFLLLVLLACEPAETPPQNALVEVSDRQEVDEPAEEPIPDPHGWPDIGLFRSFVDACEAHPEWTGWSCPRHLEPRDRVSEPAEDGTCAAGTGGPLTLPGDRVCVDVEVPPGAACHGLPGVRGGVTVVCREGRAMTRLNHDQEGRIRSYGLPVRADGRAISCEFDAHVGALRSERWFKGTWLRGLDLSFDAEGILVRGHCHGAEGQTGLEVRWHPDGRPSSVRDRRGGHQLDDILTWTATGKAGRLCRSPVPDQWSADACGSTQGDP